MAPLASILVGSLVYARGVRRSSDGFRALGIALIAIPPLVWIVFAVLLSASSGD
jgi:hypothetical protein